MEWTKEEDGIAVYHSEQANTLILTDLPLTTSNTT
jgi:hypothetical protein